MKKYKHFIFDFDGVISDSCEVAMEKFNEIRTVHFPQLPVVKSKNDFAIVYAGALKNCLDRWIGSEGTRSFFNLHSKEMLSAVENISPFEGIISIVNSLGEQNVSIVTSSYSSAVESIMSKDSLYDKNTIYKILGRELSKSKTLKIKDILLELSLHSEDIVYIGDLESDILYCREIPVDIISVGYGYHPVNYLEKFQPTYLAESVNDLGLILSEMKIC